MNDLPRSKYEIIDLIFIFLNTLCMSLTAIFFLINLIVSLIFVIVIILLAFVVLSLWISRNPFNIYLIRAFAFNNFFFTFIALIMFYSIHSATLTEYPVVYLLLLFPSIIYLIISFRFYAISTPSDKSVGAMLVYTGRYKAARDYFIGDNMEERIKREEFIAKQKEVYNLNIIIALTIVLFLSSIATLIFGFYYFT